MIAGGLPPFPSGETPPGSSPQAFVFRLGPCPDDGTAPAAPARGGGEHGPDEEDRRSLPIALVCTPYPDPPPGLPCGLKSPPCPAPKTGAGTSSAHVAGGSDSTAAVPVFSPAGEVGGGVSAPAAPPVGASRFGTFELESVESLVGFSAPVPPRQAGFPPGGGTAWAKPPDISGANDRTTNLEDRLRHLLQSRGGHKRAAMESAGTEPGAERSTRRHSPGSGELPGTAVGFPGLESGRLSGAPPTPLDPSSSLAAGLARELLPALPPRFMAGGATDTPAGIRLSFASSSHGTVGLELHGDGGSLAVTVQLQHGMNPADAEACRRSLVEVCHLRGYAEVHVELQYGGGGERGHGRRESRRGHADGDNVRLAGNEFPGQEISASPLAMARPAGV